MRATARLRRDRPSNLMGGRPVCLGARRPTNHPQSGELLSRVYSPFREDVSRFLSQTPPAPGVASEPVEVVLSVPAPVVEPLCTADAGFDDPEGMLFEEDADPDFGFE